MQKFVSCSCDILVMLEHRAFYFVARLAAGPGWELPSHQDLVPSRSRFWLGVGPGAPISQRFGPIPSHEKKFGPIPVPWDAGMGPGWDGTSCFMPRNASIL